MPPQPSCQCPLAQLSLVVDPSLLTALYLFFLATGVSGLDPITGICFRDYILNAGQTVTKGVSSGCAAASIGQWQKWIDFCTEMGINHFLKSFPEKVLILQVFIHQVCIGELAAKGNQIRS